MYSRPSVKCEIRTSLPFLDSSMKCELAMMKDEMERWVKHSLTHKIGNRQQKIFPFVF